MTKALNIYGDRNMDEQKHSMEEICDEIYDEIFRLQAETRKIQAENELARARALKNDLSGGRGISLLVAVAVGVAAAALVLLLSKLFL
jgi:hypothetical protein